MGEVKRLLSIKDENGKFILDAETVAKAQDKSLNAVYQSRKGDCKLDKLTAFDMVKKIIEDSENKKIAIAGDKNGVINTLESVLIEGTRYEVNYKEV